jgi:signal transduction histidine kinase
MTRVSELRGFEVFDGLTDAQLGELADGGTEVAVQPGAEVFHEGEPADDWWVLVEGAIDLVRRIGNEDVLVSRMDVPGRWAGGFRAWDEHAVYLATGRGAAAGRVLRVPATLLRDRVSEWFPLARHLIDGLYRTARSIESTARQREALVTLGKLAAGLAHEINNPAAATARAVDGLESATGTMLASLSALASGDLTAAQFTALDELRRQIEPPPAATADPLAAADLEDDLTSWLSGRGISRDWEIAAPLAAAGLGTDWCERAARALPGAALEPGLEWVASTLTAATLLAEIKESTRRISALVAAVRSYSHLDRASMQRVSVTDGLESTLVILGYKLRGRITVQRDYGGDVPQIEAYAGELNQVWTNLIDNAIDAMDGGGTLALTTRADGDHVVVEIADTGAGMPPEVAARAFEAFFTTKEAGKGTGLGLDIAQRIVVERHGGTISIDSEPGRTVLRVRLPVRPAGRAR